MLTCEKNDGIYNGAIIVLNKEIDGRDVTEVVQMGINIIKIDILTSEIQVAKPDTPDLAQMYKILEMKDRGNIMKNGTIWRGRTIKTIKAVLLDVLQASNVLEAYETHKNELENFIKMNTKGENMEHVGIGWTVSHDKHIKIHVKLTKRD